MEPDAGAEDDVSDAATRGGGGDVVGRDGTGERKPNQRKEL